MKSFLNFRVAGMMILIASLALPVFGQDFSRLLDAVAKVETNLKALIEKESSERKAENAKLQKQFASLPSGSSAGSTVSNPNQQAAIQQLQESVAQLKTELAQLASAQNRDSKGATVATAPAHPNLANALADIEFLKGQVLALQGQTQSTQQQLASIDEDGYTPSTQASSGELASLTEKLSTLNSKLDTYVSSEKPKNAPSIERGKMRFLGLLSETYNDKQGTVPQSSFTMRIARLGATGSINDYAKFTLIGDFAGTPKLFVGYATFLPSKEWSLTVGQFKPSFGTDYLMPSEMLTFVSTSKTASYGTTVDVGANLVWQYAISKQYGIKFSNGVYNGSGANTSDVNSDKNWVGRIDADLTSLFKVAANFYSGKSNDTLSARKNISGRGLSAQFAWKNESAQAEYIYSKSGSVKKDGWYVQAAHSFITTSKFLPQIQPAIRYDVTDPNVYVGDNKATALTIGTNFYFDSKYTRVQMNYLMNSEEGTEVDNNEFLLNFQFAF
jgi:Phosphate-selective porin O and P